MIPKRLFFIWLGSELPDYGKFCIQNFKQVNPDFEIMLVNEIDMEDIKNQDLKDCIQLIDSQEYNFYKHMVVRPFAKKYLYGSTAKDMTRLSDAFRFYLLNKYGGIYLDLDTFPVKAFDEQLLDNKGFAINHNEERCDYFFLGFESGCIDNRLIRYKKAYGKGQVFDYSQVHKIKYPEKILHMFDQKKKMLSEKFVECKLQFGESILRSSWPEYYVDHFRLGSWCK